MYEFCTITVIRLSVAKINDINLKRVSDGLSLADAELSLITKHRTEMLGLAGRYGWQSVSVVIESPTHEGDSLIYFMQRSSEHERFRIRDFETEYLDSNLCKEHQEQIQTAIRVSKSS